MADMVPECKKKLASFRIKELKDVLGQLCLAKTGRKQDLVERVLALLYRDEASYMHSSPRKKIIAKEVVAKIIDDTYRKMQHIGTSESGSAGHCGSDISSIAPKEEIFEQIIRCPCGSRLETEFMIKCADPQCHVLQHIPCVIVPEESSEGIPPASSCFYCDICRIKRSDPFWKTLAHPLYPVKLLVTSIAIDSPYPLQTVEADFQITRADVQLLEISGYDVQAWCILLNDTVPFRVQWPQYPDLKVNGIPVKTINRPGSKTLGANGRDDAPSISMYIVEGHNKIWLSCSDARTFCLGVRLVKQRTVQQVVNLIPSEQEGESFPDALARVCRCIGGGMAAANEDSDSDLEVIADNVTISLRCPMSGSRMKTAIRFKGCVHLGCFDLNTFIQINQRAKKWQCPICLKNYSLEDIIIDPYLNRIVKMMQACNEDVTEIDVKSDGSWRAKIGHPFMNLEQWHHPDGSLYSGATLDSVMETPSEKSKLQCAIYENGNGMLNVGIPQDIHASSSRYQVEEYIASYGQEVIPMSSSSSGDTRNHGFHSINQSGTANKENIIDFTLYNNNQASGIVNRSSSSSVGDQSVIVLSDSEEDNNNLVSPGVSITCPPNGSGTSFLANPGTRVAHLEDHSFPSGMTSGILNNYASLPQNLDVNARSSQTSSSKTSGSPFKFPRQPRSVRRRHVAISADVD